MNWTGGRLQRHSTAGDGVKARQKQHFAKVQQSLRNGSKKKSPIKLSIFGQEVEHHRLSQRAGSSVHRDSYGHERSHSSRPRRDNGQIVPSYEHMHNSRTDGSFRCHESVQIRPEPNRVPDDDIYNATPRPPRGTKRALEISLPTSDAESDKEGERKKESMAEKRRKILRKGDWVGLEFQKPLQIVFAPSYAETIGRRRKVSEGRRARYRDRQSHITSPFANRRQPLGAFRQGDISRQLLSRTDVRISIGGKVVLPEISSSSVYGGRGTQSSGARKRSPTISSDVMLLDGEDSQRLPIHSMISKRGLSRYHNENHAEYYPNRQQSRTKLVNLGRSEEHFPPSQSHGSQDADNEWSGFMDSVCLGPEIAQEPKDEYDSISHSSIRLPIMNPWSLINLKKSVRPGKLIYSSSSASIHHPKPQSSKVSSLLRSDSLDMAESTVAQVGKAKPVVPSSQVLDNEIWRTWVIPGDGDTNSGQNFGTQSSQDMRQVCISPGVSTVERVGGRKAPTVSKINTTSSDGDRFEVVEGLQNKSHKRSLVRRSQAQDYEERPVSRLVRSTRQSQVRGREERQFPCLIKPLHEISQAETCAAFLKPLVAESKLLAGSKPSNLPVGQKKQENLDHIWMKFVFGDGSSDEEDEAPKSQPATKHHYSAIKQNFVASSVIDHSETSYESSSAKATYAQSTAAEGSRSSQRFEVQEGVEISSQFHDIRRWDLDYDEYPSANDGRSSMHASRGSQICQIPDVTSASMVARGSSPSSKSNSSTSSQQRKALFTKSKPIIGKRPWKGKRNLERPLQDERDLIYKENQRSSGRMRKRERDIYSIVSSEDQEEEEVESIEDD